LNSKLEEFKQDMAARSILIETQDNPYTVAVCTTLMQRALEVAAKLGAPLAIYTDR
jgi:hypothetical protein